MRYYVHSESTEAFYMILYHAALKAPCKLPPAMPYYRACGALPAQLFFHTEVWQSTPLKPQSHFLLFLRVIQDEMMHSGGREQRHQAFPRGLLQLAIHNLSFRACQAY